MYQKLFIILFSFISAVVSGQELMIHKGSKSYSATPTWDFISENYALTGITKVQIAKTEKGGTLKLAVETTNPTFTIAGIVYVYLTDNTIITCSDKNNKERVGNQIVSYYLFSNLEMNKLKTADIQSIHFGIKGYAKEFNSQIGNFTALNKKSYFSTVFDKTKKSFDTALAIKLLYN